jgi:peptide chain release factor 1
MNLVLLIMSTVGFRSPDIPSAVQIRAYKEMISDDLDKELQDSAQHEVSVLCERLEAVQRDLLITLLPEEPADERNVILEVRAGAGGMEASFFAGELFQMYRQYAGAHGAELHSNRHTLHQYQ